MAGVTVARHPRPLRGPLDGARQSTGCDPAAGPPERGEGQGRAAVASRPHKPVVGGSTPSPATRPVRLRRPEVRRAELASRKGLWPGSQPQHGSNHPEDRSLTQEQRESSRRRGDRLREALRRTQARWQTFAPVMPRSGARVAVIDELEGSPAVGRDGDHGGTVDVLG